jgi:GMP synthase-like glutamine amidotransferase
MATCLVIQHVEPERAFAIGDALGAAGVSIDTRQVFAGDAVPDDAAGLDGLVVMGGPMSAASDDGFATRRRELALIADAVSRGVPTLGVCLGAQLLAAALGAAVYPGAAGPEIGWGPVEVLGTCGDDPLFAGSGPELTVLQWHGDTFDLPEGGCRLLRNSTYPNQAFRVGDVAWGLQFHVEVDVDAVEGFVAAFGADAEGVAGGVDGILTATPDAVAALAGARDLVLGRFASLVAAGVGQSRANLVSSP